MAEVCDEMIVKYLNLKLQTDCKGDKESNSSTAVDTKMSNVDTTTSFACGTCTYVNVAGIKCSMCEMPREPNRLEGFYDFIK